MIPPDRLSGRRSLPRGYPFALRWRGRRVAWLWAARLPKRTTDVVPSLRGEAPDTITLTAGITEDAAFHAWASRGGPDRVDVALEQRDELGRLATTFQLAQCRVVRYDAAPAVDPSGTVTIRSMTLEHRGWTSDVVVVEPADPFAADPDDQDRS